MSNRRNIPPWAMDGKTLMLHCIGERHMLLYTIATKYWCEDVTAREIANELKMTLGAVEKIIQRLSRKGSQL